MSDDEPFAGRRWRYVKRVNFNVDDDRIVGLFRFKGVDIERLVDGKWEPAHYRRWFDVHEDPEFIWLTKQETMNLHSWLRSGFEGIPERLDLEPAEQYRKWKCPNCHTFTIVPIVIGLPNPEDMEASMRGDIILQGCIVYGDKPDRPIACTRCGWFGEHVRGKKIRELPPSQAFAREGWEDES